MYHYLQSLVNHHRESYQMHTVTIPTSGEGFYSITDQLAEAITAPSGILHLFCPHTSCALTISEDYDPSAKADLEAFLQHLAPATSPSSATP
ncbi:MAG: YjbQ family protein [Chlamydiia bacterium]|nr:YjbQ family protein [Chlamydiia bacterium]